MSEIEIRVDAEVYQRIKAEAEPFTDTPNSVLRRKYGLDAAKAKAPRAPQGSILPEEAYEAPILRALAEMGGSGPAREVVDAVGEILGDRLTDADRSPLKSGDLRWRNRAAFVRMTLKNKGLLKSDSPRGVWELTQDGSKAASQGGPS